MGNKTIEKMRKSGVQFGCGRQKGVETFTFTQNSFGYCNYRNYRNYRNYDIALVGLPSMIASSLPGMEVKYWAATSSRIATLTILHQQISLASNDGQLLAA